MLELLAIFAVLGWLTLAFFQWLSSQPVFPAVLLALVVVPIVCRLDYLRLLFRSNLRGLDSGREPVPPERFYWVLGKSRLRRSITFYLIASLCAWGNAWLLPASLDFTKPSIVGWLNATTGMLTLSRTFAGMIFFFRASQWVDVMSPTLVGFFRLIMYRLSHNYEYLGQRRRNRVKEEVY